MTKRTRVALSILLVISALLSLTLSGCQRVQPSPLIDWPPKHSTEQLPVVIIDAGHGGEDSGALGSGGVYEKDLNLAIATELEQMLHAAGVRTRLTRDTDILLYDRSSDYLGHKKQQDMAARLAIAQEYEDAIFISIHMNHFSQSKYRGLQVYYSPNSPLSEQLASNIQSAVAANLQPDNRRKIKRSESGIYLLERIAHPCVLIECGFLSNPEECALLATQEYRSRLCMTLCASVLSYIDKCHPTSD